LLLTGSLPACGAGTHRVECCNGPTGGTGVCTIVAISSSPMDAVVCPTGVVGLADSQGDASAGRSREHKRAVAVAGVGVTPLERR